MLKIVKIVRKYVSLTFFNVKNLNKNSKKQASMLTKNNIKHIQSLHQKKFREINRQFLVEGEKMVLEAIEAKPQNIELIYYTSDFQHPIPSSISSCEISSTDLNKISGLSTPNQALAVLNYWEMEVQHSMLTLVLDTIQDPGNLGTIIRMADWFGIKQLICSKETVDFRNPKVLQATMGSIFRINVHYCDLESYLKQATVPIYGALLAGENVYHQNLPEEAIIVMGNEGKGISKHLIPLITHAIHIPRIGAAESLNVSTATAILLSEFKRNTFLK
jgi:TrmH family RNA methyltransferase